MMKNGWIKAFRPTSDDELYYDEPFTKWQAWMDLLFMAAYKDTSITVRGIRVTVLRGQSMISERQLTERWRWSREKVRRFIRLLVDLQRISPQKTNVTTLISIVNYDTYQINETIDQTTDQSTNETTEEEVKEEQQKKKRNSKRVSKKEGFTVPTREEVEKYVDQIGSHIDIGDFFNYYEATDWKVQGKPMKNWKLTVQTWTKKDRAQRPYLYDGSEENKGKQTESKWQG